MRESAKVGKQLRALRKAAGLTQEELSERLACSDRTLRRIESGGVLLTVETLARYAVALGRGLQIEVLP